MKQNNDFSKTSMFCLVILANKYKDYAIARAKPYTEKNLIVGVIFS